MRSSTQSRAPLGVIEVDVRAPGGGWLWAERSGVGTPVVLLHGAGMDARLWDSVQPDLARHHDVIRYDARGLGRSAPPGKSFSDVEDLRAVLAIADLLVAGIPGARGVVIPSADHYLPLRSPQRLAELLLEHLP